MDARSGTRTYGNGPYMNYGQVQPPYPFRGDTLESNMLEIEMERLSISLSKSARSILEELGTGCTTSENDDMTVPSGSVPYETIDEVRDMLVLGDSLSRTPWGQNARDNRSYYIVDTGHAITVKPREQSATRRPAAAADQSPPPSASSESVRRVERFLEVWMEENGWQSRQAEVSRRLDEHGEVFDLLSYDEAGVLRTYFAEPWDLDDDPSSPYQDSEDTSAPYIDYLGVRRTNDARYLERSYYIDGRWYAALTSMSPLSFAAIASRTTAQQSPLNRQAGEMLVQHRKRNVLSNDSRGLTLFWPVREELIWSKKLLSNMMRVSGFQAAFGAIRTISAVHGTDAVKSYLASQQAGTAGTGGSGQNFERFDQPAPAVVTVPETVKYEFPETGIGQSNHIDVLVQLLRACASGMKLPEFMLTANVSEGNFASTLVSEGPFHKSMRFEQSLMVREDKRILMEALWYAAMSGEHDLTVEDVQAVILEVKPPRVQTRNRQEDFDVNQKLWEDGLLSGKDHLAAEGHEYESQMAQIESERKEDPGPPLAVASTATPPGPTPASDADPMKEKGVLAGDPGRKTQADQES